MMCYLKHMAYLQINNSYAVIPLRAMYENLEIEKLLHFIRAIHGLNIRKNLKS